MDLYFDTSAFVPLFLEEARSQDALSAMAQAERVFAWRWMQVETEAALTRRRAKPRAWSEWRRLAASIHWLELSESSLPAVCTFNRALRLRAADAGHLFVFDRALSVVPELHLVSHDREMVDAAGHLGLPCLD
jgi:predicted nucleic acid-binding protein